jgi:hypothetical protein
MKQKSPTTFARSSGFREQLQKTSTWEFLGIGKRLCLGKVFKVACKQWAKLQKFVNNSTKATCQQVIGQSLITYIVSMASFIPILPQSK